MSGVFGSVFFPLTFDVLPVFRTFRDVSAVLVGDKFKNTGQACRGRGALGLADGITEYDPLVDRVYGRGEHLILG